MLSYLNLLVVREIYWEDAVVSAYNADVHWYFVVWQSDRWLHKDKYLDQRGRSSWSQILCRLLTCVESVLKERGIERGIMGTEVVFLIALLFLHFRIFFSIWKRDLLCCILSDFIRTVAICYYCLNVCGHWTELNSYFILVQKILKRNLMNLKTMVHFTNRR